MEKEILLKEYNIRASEKSDTLVIKIYDESGERNLGLRGSPDMLFALGMELMNIELPVVMAQDVMSNIVTELGGKLTKVLIYDIIDSKLHSRLYFESGSGEQKFVEIGVSDALALALKKEIPVYAYESVFEKDLNQRQSKINWWDLDEDFVLDVLNNSTDEDFAPCSIDEINSYLKKAVEAEDYDLAAKLKSIIASKEAEKLD